jgi:hypothetical protein
LPSTGEPLAAMSRSMIVSVVTTSGMALVYLHAHACLSWLRR